jgi:hypothetical protein
MAQSMLVGAVFRAVALGKVASKDYRQTRDLDGMTRSNLR